jgi:site-specific DNA recombinase
MKEDQCLAATRRCAIYTRKSTEEGLEQDFNSLQAQREAAEAFIHSQKNLGWTALPRHYDDGGFSGGTLDRPGLQALLSDIEAGQVDCVVVYKVDRLSRSLLDFARLMERFEKRSISFVAVTQQFNTTTSLGRLTLNILLSFAQFERELISERTRDKMSAARRKGKWVGGRPVLGYDIDSQNRRLVVNEKEAERVRQIFDFYQRERSLDAVVAELAQRGWTTKVWTSQRGIRHGGHAFTKASLKMLVSNAVYAGLVRYRGVIYPGEHAPIVDAALWEAINHELERDESRRPSIRTRQNALLAGVLMCKSCEQPMLATYTVHGGRRYRYYICPSGRRKGRTCSTKSVAASRMEESLLAQLRARLSVEETRLALNVPERDWQVFLEGEHTCLVPGLVEAIRYDGETGMVSVQLRRLEGLPGDRAQ